MTRGAILIGYGSLPTKADVQDAMKSRWIRNCDTVTTTSFPASVAPDRDLHFMTYLAAQKKKGWDAPGGLQAMKITTADGRVIYSVYPLAGDAPLGGADKPLQQATQKSWWQFWKR